MDDSSEMSIPTRVLLINDQGVAVRAMPLKMGVIERQVVVPMLDFQKVPGRPSEQGNQEADDHEYGKANQCGDTAMCRQKPA